MNKLRKKIFFILFFVLTFFLMIPMITMNFNNYNSNKNILIDTIKRYPIQNNNELFKIKIDNNYIIKVTSCFGKVNDNDISKLKKSIKRIVKSRYSNYYIGNLYIEDYSYRLVSDREVEVFNNFEISDRLRKILILSVLFVSLGEIAICFICNFITGWIVKPVEESFEKQKDFIADASHELKTPIAVINAQLDAYKNSGDEKWIDNIETETNKMSLLIKNLLDLSLLENEKDTSTKYFEKQNISDLVEGEILTFEALFFEEEISLQYNIEPDIEVRCNKEQIKQLVSILVDNSIKHSKKNCKVSIDLKKISNEVVLRIENELLKEEQNIELDDRVFERFYKGDKSRNRNNNSYGLGLAIAKQIVLNHGGAIKAYKEEDKAVFEVRIE